MIIAVDFDGTLHDGEWPSIGSPTDDAVHIMQRLKEDRHYIILYTCREGEALLNAINWMLDNHIPFDRVNDNHPEKSARYGWNSRKVYAHVYIDDKQISPLPSWRAIYDTVTELEREYQRKTADNGTERE